MKIKLAIIHFLPLELYPPVMNLLDYLSASKLQLDILVFSTKADEHLTAYENTNISIIRFAGIDPKSTKPKKLLRYVEFYVLSFIKILKFKPDSILYYETLSALTALWYKSINSNVNLFVHYHEITTLKQLDENRVLEKYINSLEKKYYSSCKWISQTNLDRLKLFQKQYPLITDYNLKILPNYPPASWLKHNLNTKNKNSEVKLLYVGTLNTDQIYLENLLARFGSKSKFSIDFYSHSLPDEAKHLISEHNNCNYKGPINYKDIPNLRGIYDAGLILYKGNLTNTIYCAPNKLFEYLALDLDVWCSNKLITAKDYERLDCHPKVIMIDYNHLNEFNVKEALDKHKLKYRPSPYQMEKVNCQILKKIQNKPD